MPLYLLSRKEEDVDYAEFEAKVIRAKDDKEARSIANQDTGAEGQIWEDLLQVTCTRIPIAGKSKEILSSFNAG